MGCGASNTAAVDPSQQLPDKEKKENEKKKDGNEQDSTEKPDATGKKKKKDGTSTTSPDSQTVKKFAAFVIPVDDNPIDSIIKRTPPRRLQTLAPIQKPPVLTAEMLEERMRLAEAKRERMLKKKTRVGKKSSKKRQEIMKAREQAQSTEQSAKAKVDEAQELAEKNRQEKLAAMKEKARLREEKLKSARERAQRIKTLRAEEDSNIDYELDRMETAPADDDTDSWLDGENNTNGPLSAGSSRFDSAGTDRVYSGRASPKKKVGGKIRVAPSSASTVDSFSMAFQRESSADKKALPTIQTDKKTDSFFD